METGITKMIGSELERRWLKELTEVNGRLDQAETLQEYMDILADSRKWNSLAFNLRRFVYRRFADVAVETATGWQVTFEGKTYRFSPVTAFDDIPEVEKRRYAELLYRLTLKNRAFDRLKDGTHNDKAGVITKQQYLNYLNGKRPYRRQVFILALALGLDGDDMETFMNTLGESPVFNFRDARECIYYFCIALPQFRNQETAERLEAWYAGLEGTAMSEPAPREEGTHTTEALNWRLDDIIWGEYPDDAAREAVTLVENSAVTVIDTSTAHRTHPDWAYGFPELTGQREKLRASRRIANPGCHASGFVALVAPLVEKGLVDKSALLTSFSLTGYSGGGKKMIAEYEDANRDALLKCPRQYALTQQHKHLK